MVLTDAQKEIIEKKRLDAVNKRKYKNNPGYLASQATNSHGYLATDTSTRQAEPNQIANTVYLTLTDKSTSSSASVALDAQSVDIQNIIEVKRYEALRKRANKDKPYSACNPQSEPYKTYSASNPISESYKQNISNPQSVPYKPTSSNAESESYTPYHSNAESESYTPYHLQPYGTTSVNDVVRNSPESLEAKRMDALNKLKRTRTITPSSTLHPPIAVQSTHHMTSLHQSNPMINQQHNQIVINSSTEAKRSETLGQISSIAVSKQLIGNQSKILPTQIQTTMYRQTSDNGVQSMYSQASDNGVQFQPQISVKDQIEANRRKALELRANKPKKATLVPDPPVQTPATVEHIPIQNQGEPVLHSGPVLTATCCLISASRFAVQTKYNAQLIGLLKTLQTRQYDKIKCQWSFDIAEHEELLAAVRPLLPAVKVLPLPKHVVNILKLPKNTPISLGDDTKILKALLPFQRIGVEFALAHHGRALIADDMGLGKTVQAIAIMQEYRKDWPLLVICPSSLRLTWAEAFLYWLDELKQTDIKVIFKGSNQLEGEHITIISYDLLSKFNLKSRFGCVIADESHFLKNSKSARCKAAVAVLQNARRCLLLSGTPALSKPIELFTQLLCVDRWKMPTVQEFGVRYCDGMKNAWGWDFNGHSNLEELNIFMSSHFMIRRLKVEVLDELPAKCRKKVIIESKVTQSLNVAARVADNASKKDYQASFFNYYSETAEAKAPGVIHYIDELLEAEKKFLLFAHHQSMISALKGHFIKQKVQYILIDGKTPGDQRQLLCDKFQDNKSCCVALLSITAANTGLTLTAADTVVFAELFWNPGVLVQAEDRVHRIGQKDSVVIHYLVAHRTSDDKMWPLIERKLSILGNMGVSSGDFKDAACSRYNAVESSDQTDIMDFFKAIEEPDSKRRRL